MKYSEQILFSCSALILYYFAGENTYDNDKNQRRGNIRNNNIIGVFGVIAFLCMMSALRPSIGPFTSYQWFWRVCYQITLLYNASLIFLIFQNESEARQLMRLGDETLGTPITKDRHTYDDNCDLNWVNFYDNFDHYFLIHCVNWFTVSLMLRDAWILNIWQVWDELIELSWQHILPHFKECWWDHVIIDMLLSNTIAIILGCWVVKKVGIAKYDWFGRYDRTFTKWEIWNKYT